MRVIILLLLVCGLSVAGFARQAPVSVTVSVGPIKTIVENIGKDRVNTTVVVPPGASPHSYEPKSKQAVKLANTEIFFCVGEGFEKRLSSSLLAANPHLKIIDLRECIDPLPSHCHCHAQEIDSHIWLSPAQLRKISRCVYETLMTHDPQGTSTYKKNFTILETKINQIAQMIEARLSDLTLRTFVTAHAAFGYFCRDYNLTQLALENKGKQATPKAVVILLEEAREKGVKLVLAEPQYNQKGARSIAKELKAHIVMIDPYSEDVFANLKVLTAALCLHES